MFQQINAVASTLIVALVFLVATFWQSSGSNPVHERRGIATNRRKNPELVENFLKCMIEWDLYIQDE